MLPDLNTLEQIDEPLHLYEMADGKTLVLTPLGWKIGQTTIQPRDGRPAKKVYVLRIAVPVEEMRYLPGRWDFTSKHLIAGLLPYLQQLPKVRWRFKITGVGSGPAARPMLEAVRL